MGGHHYPAATRRTAVEAWVEAGKPELDNMAAAVHRFRSLLPKAQLPSNPSEFMRTWVSAWLERVKIAGASQVAH